MAPDSRDPLPLEQTQDVAVRVLDEGDLLPRYLGDALLVGLDRALVVLLEAETLRGELVHDRLDPRHEPAPQSRPRLAGVLRRGIDVKRGVPGALIGDAAVGGIRGSAREAEL